MKLSSKGVPYCFFHEFSKRYDYFLKKYKGGPYDFSQKITKIVIHHWISTEPPPHARGRTWFFRKIRKNHDDFLRKNHVLPEEILYGTTRFFRKIRENKFFFLRNNFANILRKNMVLPYFTEEHSSSVFSGRTMFFRKIFAKLFRKIKIWSFRIIQFWCPLLEDVHNHIQNGGFGHVLHHTRASKGLEKSTSL